MKASPQRKKFALATFFFVLMLGLWGSTQSLAAQVEYHALLGSPFFVYRQLPIYLPYEYLVWSYTFYDVLPNVINRASKWLYFSLLVGIFLSIFLMKSNQLSSHGTARWATEVDIKKSKILDKKGVILGRNPYGPETEGDNFIRHDGPEHILMMAPTRSGKGVGAIVPTLLTWQHSALITDIKGENWGITAGYRQKHLGNKVLKFAPTLDDGSSVKYNPLFEIRLGTSNEMRDVQNIADMLVDPEGKGQMDHWAKTGHALLVGTIIHLMYVFRKEGRGVPSLADVASFLSRPDATFEASLSEMKNYHHISEDEFFENNVFERIYDEYVKDLSVLKDTLRNFPVPDFYDKKYSLLLTHPKVAEAAAEMQNKSDNEKSGVLSTAMSFLGLYRDPVIAKNTSGSEFSVEDLLREDMAVSLYLVTPPSDINRMRPLIRMILNLVIRRLTEQMEFKDGKKVEKKQRLLLLLDEFPALGNLDSMESALAFIAGYGMKAFLIVQSLNQLNKIYTKDNSIIDNCHVRIFYTPNDPETPGYVSKMLGKETIKVRSQSNNGGFLNSSTSTSETGRELLDSGEVSQLEFEKSIIFVTGHPPILAKKLFYYNEEFFKARLMDAPAKSDTIRHIAS